MRLIILLIVSIYLSTAFSNEKKIWIIEDTMITGDYIGLYKIPNSRNPKDEFISLKPNSLIYVLDKNPVPNELKHNAVDFFLKVRTMTGQNGYIWIDALISKKQFQQHQDSLKLWATSPRPSYNNLIGTTYSKKESLPMELSRGQFVTVGKDQNYSLSSVGNIYNKNYDYIFFEKMNNPGTDKLSYTIVDIIALDLTKLKNDATVWFQQCKCQGMSGDCSDVVAVYCHNEKMAKKNIMVKPDIAWRPNYSSGKLETISPESVKCGSMASEEDAGGP